MLLEQSFSNYRLIIHDNSANQAFLPVIKEIPDVRIQYLSTPGGALKDVLVKSLESAKTSLVTFFQAGSFRDVLHLKEIMDSAYSSPLESQQLTGAELPEFGKIYQRDFISSLL